MDFLLPTSLKERRRFLAQNFDVARKFEALEESCIPSYLHKNIFASWVAWSRLTKAAKLFERYVPDAGKGKDILDFGAGSGELNHILTPLQPHYHFTESDTVLRDFILQNYPQAVLADMNDRTKKYDAIFALDSLEHNEDYSALLADLAGRLKPEGVLILSGPTENFLYRFGRRVAGFSGHYHHTTIYDIEKACAAHLSLVKRVKLPLGVPLFSLSVWGKK